MGNFLGKFERTVVITLLTMMALIVALATVEFAILLVKEIFATSDFLFLNIDELFTLFGFLFMILIGLEVMESIKVYLKESTLHVESVLLIAVIAITRKVIVMDFKLLPPITILGIAALIIALTGGYFLIKKSSSSPKQ